MSSALIGQFNALHRRGLILAHLQIDGLLQRMSPGALGPSLSAGSGLEKSGCPNGMLRVPREPREGAMESGLFSRGPRSGRTLRHRWGNAAS